MAAEGEREQEERRHRQNGAVRPARAARLAREQLADLLGREPEAISALARTEDGWTADVEVVEMERIPPTTSVLATYRVTLDEDGELSSYQRVRRYTRGQIDRR
jgi:hypothetical protein